MVKIKAFLIKLIFIIYLICLISGPSLFLWSHNFINTNISNVNTSQNSSNSYTWSRIWGTEKSIGDKIITDTSYNVYILGRFYEYPGSRTFNIKYDNYGFELWNKTWIFNDYCYIADFTIDTQFNLYNLINLNSPDSSILMKINNSGFSEWNQTIEGIAGCIYLDKFDNIYISGHIWDGINDKEYIFLKKLDQNGISIWNNTFRLDEFYYFLGYPSTIMVDHLNQTYVAGILDSLGFPGETSYFSFGGYIPAPYAYISIYNSSGNLISFHKWRIEDYYIKSNMIFDTSFNLYLMGVDKSLSHNTLFKYNPSGYLLFSISQWHNDAIGETFEFWETIALDPSNHIYCAGKNYFWTGTPNYELYIVKFDNQSNLEWDGAYKLLHDTHCSDIYIDSNYSLYLTGINGDRTVVLKNPIVKDFSDPFYINIELVLSISSIFLILGLIGIFFYVRFLRRSPNKTT